MARLWSDGRLARVVSLLCNLHATVSTLFSPWRPPGDTGVIYMRCHADPPPNAACLWRSFYPDGKGVGCARKAGVGANS
jgi:hypothetical protein